jgi:hypothetical protein
MKRILLAVIAALVLLAPIAAYAACTTQTYLINGRVVICTVCCAPNGNCTTSCF